MMEKAPDWGRGLAYFKLGRCDTVGEGYLEEHQEDYHSDCSVANEVHGEGRGDDHSGEKGEEDPSGLDDKAGKS